MPIGASLRCNRRGGRLTEVCGGPRPAQRACKILDREREIEHLLKRPVGRAWTNNRRADWKTAQRIVKMVRLLPFGAYPSGAYMENPR